MVPVLAAAFTLAVGWERVWQRFQQNDPYLVRREFLAAALDMARHRRLPDMAWGHSRRSTSDTRSRIFRFTPTIPQRLGGVCRRWRSSISAAGADPFAAGVPSAIRHPWGLGLVSIMLHACVDFPFPRPAVSCWMFAMLGLLYMVRTRMTKTRGKPSLPYRAPQPVWKLIADHYRA